MKTLTITIPDTLDINQERQLIAANWYKAGKLTAAQAAQIAGLQVAAFLAIAEPQTSSDRMLQKIARPIAERYNLETLKQDKKYTGLNWSKLDHLAESITIKEPIEQLIAQIGK